MSDFGQRIWPAIAGQRIMKVNITSNSIELELDNGATLFAELAGEYDDKYLHISLKDGKWAFEFKEEE